MLQIIKKIFLKYKFLTLILSKIYVLYRNLILKEKIKITKDGDHYIHTTSYGKIAYPHPLFDAEEYVSKDYGIYFEKYVPKKDDVVLELGSGIGNESIYISKLIGENGKIYCVEPFLKIFETLKKTIAANDINNAKLINKALYYEKTNIGFSSSNNWLASRIDHNSENKIETFTLNNFIFENKIDKINFCKINIEGAERFIVNDSNEFFNICENLAIECHDFLERKGNPEEYMTFEIVKNFLKSKSFNIKKSNRNKLDLDKYFIHASKSI